MTLPHNNVVEIQRSAGVSGFETAMSSSFAFLLIENAGGCNGGGNHDADGYC